VANCADFNQDKPAAQGEEINIKDPAATPTISQRAQSNPQPAGIDLPSGTQETPTEQNQEQQFQDGNGISAEAGGLQNDAGQTEAAAETPETSGINDFMSNISAGNVENPLAAADYGEQRQENEGQEAHAENSAGIDIPQPADGSGMEDIKNTLQRISSNSLSKEDVKTQLDAINDSISNIQTLISESKNQKTDRPEAKDYGAEIKEILTKLASLEDEVKDIKTAVSSPVQAAATAGDQNALTNSQVQAFTSALSSENISHTYGSFMNPADSNVQGMDQLAPADISSRTISPLVAQPDAAASQPKPQKKKKKGPGIIKKFFKLIFWLVFLAALLFCAAFLLKTYKIFDVSKFIPYNIPLISSPQSSAPEKTPDWPQQSEAGDSTQPQAENAPAAAEEDLSRIIDAVKTYTMGGSVGLDDVLCSHAAEKNMRCGEEPWEASSVSSGVYLLSKSVYPAEGQNKISCSFEVDFDNGIKNIKPKDIFAEEVLAKMPVNQAAAVSGVNNTAQPAGQTAVQQKPAVKNVRKHTKNYNKAKAAAEAAKKAAAAKAKKASDGYQVVEDEWVEEEE